MVEGSRFGLKPDKEQALAERLERLGVREEDLLEKFIRASGPGGQKVNKTSTAVFLKHLPSGVEVKSQQARTQALNRFLARRSLAERLEAQELGRRSEAAAKAAKIRRQKRRRSRRSRARMLADKRHQSEKKELRKPPSEST